VLLQAHWPKYAIIYYFGIWFGRKINNGSAIRGESLVKKLYVKQVDWLMLLPFAACDNIV
jgi:hypothetical protein